MPLSVSALSERQHSCNCTIAVNKWLANWILGKKGVYRLQRLLRNIHRSRNLDDWRLRPEPSHLDGKFLAIHFGHEIVHDDNVNRMNGASSSPLPPLGAVREILFRT